MANYNFQVVATVPLDVKEWDRKKEELQDFYKRVRKEMEEKLKIKIKQLSF